MARSSTSLDTYVMLLRGINLGGKNKLPMKALLPLLEGLGCAHPRHYIQSGNVVLQASAKRASTLAEKAAQAIATQFELTVPVVLRSADELRAVTRTNPYLKSGAELDTLHVMFLADEPERSRVAALDPQRSPPDTFEVRGRDIFLCLPNGVARSKLTNAYFDSQLDTVSTARNWRTVLTLIGMCDG
jgi:uncharacterized protein (DUF1697 family)